LSVGLAVSAQGPEDRAQSLTSDRQRSVAVSSGNDGQRHIEPLPSDSLGRAEASALGVVDRRTRERLGAVGQDRALLAKGQDATIVSLALEASRLRRPTVRSTTIVSLAFDESRLRRPTVRVLIVLTEDSLGDSGLPMWRPAAAEFRTRWTKRPESECMKPGQTGQRDRARD
jgi:hypothetical protein